MLISIHSKYSMPTNTKSCIIYKIRSSDYINNTQSNQFFSSINPTIANHEYPVTHRIKRKWVMNLTVY